MSGSAAELMELLDLQDRGQGLFTGPPAPERIAFDRVFGGQLLSQALAAATFTAPTDWPCHSLHAYFVRPGKPGRPIDYEVSAMRDGQRFATRKVVAVQRDEVIFELISSFESEEPGAEHQEPMPATPPPESFPSEDERIARALEKATPAQRQFLQSKMPIEFIMVDERDPQRSSDVVAVRYWMRVRGTLLPDASLQRCVLVYASDMGALEPSMRAIGSVIGDPTMQVASLDHAVWFHRPFRFDDWLLFTWNSVSVAAGRGLSRGTVHTRDGRHVASLMQEGVMRARSEP